jgi:hypothetical protein
MWLKDCFSCPKKPVLQWKMLLGNYLGTFLYRQRLVLCRLAAAARGVKMSHFYLNITIRKAACGGSWLCAAVAVASQPWSLMFGQAGPMQAIEVMTKFVLPAATLGGGKGDAGHGGDRHTDVLWGDGRRRAAPALC